ncbi:phosphoribosyltransferase domain-containing protein [Clostridium sp.]|uniref:phosphoribosyltransferase domain-containing protein n=1 Tax=Clostridium sp. TaxID=1506 RepID=UPI003F3C6A5A
MSIDIEIKENIYKLDLNDLICVGNRINNSKRNFLFISKVLGKHIEVKPSVCKDAGRLLADLYYKNNKEKDEKICVLGFAETATGLGMAVAAGIKGSYYLTTTREDITEKESILKFEEEHSHATTHKCFPINEEKLINADKIVLVDDEITTGKSMINIIKELKRVTKTKEYIILSILDWRNKEYRDAYDKLSKEEEIKVTVLSAINGEIKVNDKRVFIDNEDNVLTEKASEVLEVNILDRINVKTSNGDEKESFLSMTGRFGVDYKDIQELEEKCRETANIIQEKIGEQEKILVLGHGENIYIPSRVANYLKGDVYYKSTTRSPIYCNNELDYPINQKDVFYHKGVKYYFYNRNNIEEKYDKVILLTEDDLNIKLTNNMLLVRI